MKEKLKKKDSTRAKAHSKALLAAFLTTSLLASCTQELSDTMVGSEAGISFRAVMNDMKKTKITDSNNWEGVELLGVFMVSEQTADLQSAKYFPVTPFRNLKHSVDLEGKLTNETTTLFSYPLDDSFVKFIAYYPYIEYSQAEADSTSQSGDVKLLANNGAGMVVAQSYASSGLPSSQSGKAITVGAASGFRTRTSEDDSDSAVGADLALLTMDNLYPIDLSDSRDHDFLYAVSLESYNRQDKDKTVELQFDHMMSKLVLTVKVRYYNDEQKGDSSGDSLAYHDEEAVGVTATILRSTKAKFDLLGGSFQAISDTASLAMSASGNSVSSIILPGEDKDSKIILRYKGHSYTWNTSSINFESGKQYNYTLTLRPRYTDVLLSSTITGWKEESGNKEVNEDFTGNGGEDVKEEEGNNMPGSESDEEDDDEEEDEEEDEEDEEEEITSFGYKVYTSNPELSTYGNAGNSSDELYNININDSKYIGLRLASSSKSGERSIKVSKETNKISFYAKGINESTLTVSVTGAKLKNDDGSSTSKAIKLEKDSTQTFANATYTFTVTDKDHYVFDLVDVTKDITVKFKAEVNNNCFIWGVNYE